MGFTYVLGLLIGVCSLVVDQIQPCLKHNAMANRRSCPGIFVAMVLVAVAVAWDEVPKQSHSVSLAQGASTDVDVVGVDAILDHVKATLVAKTPAAESPLNSALSVLPPRCYM